MRLSVRRREICRAAICVAALALLMTGCNVYEPNPATPSTKATEAARQLDTLPTLEETKAQLQAAVAEIKGAADRVKPGLQWQSLHGESNDYCQAPYEKSDGERLFLPDEVAFADLSEADWNAVLEATKTAAARLDANDTQAMKDQPGNHDVGFYGPAGLFIKVSYTGNLVVSTYTGCRLPESKTNPGP